MRRSAPRPTTGGSVAPACTRVRWRTRSHAPELAWRVATEESEKMRRIREEVVLVQVPVMNSRDWYNGYMFHMPESPNVARLLYQEWFPQRAHARELIR